VIEQVTTLFLKKNGITTDKLELNVKLEKVAKILLQNGMKDRELKFLRTMATDRDSRYSPDTLGHFVHGGAVPTHKDGIKIWDNLEHVIETMLDQLR
jgi:hypothetical protein